MTFFFPGRCQLAKLREKLGDVDSKLEIISEYLFLKIKGQGHSFFPDLTLGTLSYSAMMVILTGIGRWWGAWGASEQTWVDNLPMLIFRELTPFLLESVGCRTMRGMDYMGRSRPWNPCSQGMFSLDTFCQVVRVQVFQEDGELLP